ncbi:retrovirus-related pol polyprotein from transposon TNT 1-94 [Tanacetum coccineum]|uniref:Retrovirus-related pol polyprotein from transposon TNT 1-94 n=1 Tax=Tanacetum coccineum TaxID=301880 RepID=A0ABQ5H4G8_9ASTR
MPKIRKPKKLVSKERLASPKPSRPSTCLRWSPTGRMFDLKGKIIASSESECQSDRSSDDNAYSGCSMHMTGNLKLLINFVWKFLRMVRFGNDHIAAILAYCDLQWGNILITMVYFVDGLGHNLFSVGQFCDSDLEVAFRRNTCFIRNLEGVHLSKHEAPEEIKIFLKKITVLLQALVIIVRTDNGTEFKNQVLKEYFDSVGISHQASSDKTPQQNGVVERRDRTLLEAARIMLIFSRAPLFLWAEVIATACYTQVISFIRSSKSSIDRGGLNKRGKKYKEVSMMK